MTEYYCVTHGDLYEIPTTGPRAKISSMSEAIKICDKCYAEFLINNFGAKVKEESKKPKELTFMEAFEEMKKGKIIKRTDLDWMILYFDPERRIRCSNDSRPPVLNESDIESKWVVVE